MMPWQALPTGVCGRLIAANMADGSWALTAESLPRTDSRRKEERHRRIKMVFGEGGLAAVCPSLK
jgi:hypothetical protein